MRSLASYDGDSRLKLLRAEVLSWQGMENTAETVFHVDFILIVEKIRDSKDWGFLSIVMT